MIHVLENALKIIDTYNLTSTNLLLYIARHAVVKGYFKFGEIGDHKSIYSRRVVDNF